MAEWARVSTHRPDISSLFDKVIASMGSLRVEAFDALRKRLATDDALSSHETEFVALAALDIESTQFETDFLNLRDTVAEEVVNHINSRD